MKVRAADVGGCDFDENVGRLLNLRVRNLLDTYISRPIINYCFHDLPPCLIYALAPGAESMGRLLRYLAQNITSS
jgi:hypothetical protein